jgi:RNA ligase (TIGR02306 family)
MRKLVTIRKVLDIQPIKDADRIELLSVGGWKVIAQKGLYKVNDLVLYCEVDTFLPVSPEFEFLRKSSYKRLPDGTEGFRIKTMKMKNVVSQGLVLPLSDYPDEDFSDTKKDYSELLGATKYEEPIPSQLSGEIFGSFPTYIIPKTDQERIQNLSDEIEYLSSLEYEISEKIDGCSTSYYLYNDHFGICSRNLELKPKDNLAQQEINVKYKIEEQLKSCGKNIAIQGELIGPGIQGNPYKLNQKDFYVFDIYDIDNQRYFTSEERLELIKSFNMKHVPILNHKANMISPLIPMSCDSEELTKTQIDFIIQDLLLISEGESTITSGVIREGLVWKSVDGNKSFKTISNKYLLKGEK